MVKIFVSDLDGTLLNKDNAEDDKIVQGVKKVISQGYEFVIATGRNIHGVSINSGLWELPIYVIASNGAVVLNKERKVIYEKGIDKKIIEKVLKKEGSESLDYVSLNKTYSKLSRQQYLLRFHKNMGLEYDENNLNKQFDRYLSNHIYEASDEMILSEKILKINGSKKNNYNFKALLEFLEDPSNKIVNAPFRSNHFEITASNVNKAVAIDYLTKKLDTRENEIIVYGDGENDIEMLQHFSNSNATENACEKAKEVASNVIGHHKDYAVINNILSIIEKESK